VVGFNFSGRKTDSVTDLWPTLQFKILVKPERSQSGLIKANKRPITHRGALDCDDVTLIRIAVPSATQSRRIAADSNRRPAIMKE
jgi:hypothetical protein